MKLIRWIKTLLRIVENYDEHIAYLRERVNITDREAVKIIRKLNETAELMRERTEVHTDVPHFRGHPCTVIVCGKYKANDYVDVRVMGTDEFAEIVSHLKELSRYAHIKTVDAPFQLREYIRKEI